MKKIQEFLKYADPFVILAVTVPFAVYMLTLAPTVTFFDSGEFLTAIYSFGSAHSPGYPFFINYTKPFTYLPVGNFAFRVNMATAFSSALACLGVYMLGSYLLKREVLCENEQFSRFAVKAAALAGALAFAVTPRLWLQTNHDKPYPILAFMTAIIFLCLFKWRDAMKCGYDRPSFIYASAFIAGICMSVHQTIILLVPAWAFMIIITDWRCILRVKELIITVFFAFLGFAIHLHLPVRALKNPLLNWGDPKSFKQFKWHFLREGYPVEPPVRDLKLTWLQMKAFNIPYEFTWVGVLLILLGCAFLWKRNRELLFAYFFSVCIFLAVIVGYLNTPADMVFLTEEFFTPLYLLTSVLVALGLFRLLLFAVEHSKQQAVFGLKVYLTIMLLLFSFPASLCAINYYENDQHNNYIAFDYGTNTLRTLPQNAIMFTWGDSGAFPLWYLQGVEKMREDVDLPHTPHLVFNWYLDSMPRIFSRTSLRQYNAMALGAEACLNLIATEQFALRPVYLDYSSRYSVPLKDFVPEQRGILFRVKKISDPSDLPDVSLWDTYNSRGIFERISFIDLDTGKAILIYAASYLEMGEFLLNIGRMQEGLEMLRRSEAITADYRSSVAMVLDRFGLKRTW